MRGRRILAIRAGALGDTILVLPAIATLRERAGSSGAVELLGRMPAADLLAEAGQVAAVHSIDRALFRGFYHPQAVDPALDDFLARFDLVVSWSRLPLLEERLSRLGIPGIEQDPVPTSGVHASDYFLHALAPLGVTGPAPLAEIVPSERSRAAALEFLERSGLEPGEYVAVHPSSGSPRKNWPRDRFEELARRILHDRQLLWIEGEADGGVVSKLARLVPAPVARMLPLGVLASVLKRSHGYVGNDSGVSHLAAAVNAPVVALFGPTDAKIWSPRGRKVAVADFAAGAGDLWEMARSSVFRR